MKVSSFKGRVAVVAAAFGVMSLTAGAASAQSLWGGDAEWGGGKQSVNFGQQFKPGQIIVSFGDRRLYHVTAPGRATSYPIAVPREQSRWEGNTVVSQKRENPSWTPTPEMIRENPRLPAWVPGGHPMNPLGNRAMYLGSSTYRIHGTDAPWTIGQAVSKGCIRMFNQDVAELYPKIAVGTRVTVTWQRFNGGALPQTASAEPTPKAAAAAPDNDDDRAARRKAYLAKYQSKYFQNRTARNAPRPAAAQRSAAVE